MPYSMNPENADCYEGTSCLINNFDIRDAVKLGALEKVITYEKISEFDNDSFSDFTEKGYRLIHKRLFEDIYPWAGEYRKVDISKGATRFAPADLIPELMANCFKRLFEKNCFKGEPFDDFVDDIVDFYCVTNYIHPFREGNGRTQRLFLSKLIESAGFRFEFSSVDGFELMVATIQASQGVRDNLLNLFRTNLKKHK